jgi:hypothetical protein
VSRSSNSIQQLFRAMSSRKRLRASLQGELDDAAKNEDE